jgi:hypothetical protein
MKVLRTFFPVKWNCDQMVQENPLLQSFQSDHLVALLESWSVVGAVYPPGQTVRRQCKPESDFLKEKCTDIYANMLAFPKPGFRFCQTLAWEVFHFWGVKLNILVLMPVTRSTIEVHS